MLQKEFQWYLDNQSELVKKYSGQYLVISDNEVLFSSADKELAYNKGIELAGLGKFILQLCTPGEGAYTMTFHTHRVSFARQ